MSKVRKILFGVLPVLALSACADDNTGNDQLVQTLDDNGAVIQATKSSGDPGELRDAHSRLVTIPSQVSPRTSGCTHIQFCDAPGADQVVCITNDSTRAACTRDARFNECISDANFVCGTDWTSITFKPPI